MIKKLLTLHIVFFALAYFALGMAYAEEDITASEKIFVLPSSLQRIEEGAFCETAVQTAFFPQGLLVIENNAFEDARGLQHIYIPPSTRYIADSAFPSNIDLVLHGVRGSYAQKWAKKHGVGFVAENIWKHKPNYPGAASVRIAEKGIVIHDVNQDISVRMIFESWNEIRSRRPQDRPELNPIDYRFP